MMRSKATNASMQMRREQSHNQWTNKYLEAYQMIAGNKSFPIPNATTQKWTFSLNYANETREKKECNFWSFCSK